MEKGGGALASFELFGKSRSDKGGGALATRGSLTKNCSVEHKGKADAGVQAQLHGKAGEGLRVDAAHVGRRIKN